MLLIYSERITPRVEYTFRLFFGVLLKTRYRLTSSPENLHQHEGPSLSYAGAPFGNGLFIESCGLLYEQTLREQHPGGEGEEFFRTSPRSAFPFDIFSASFFLVTRYEEQLSSYPTDAHGRFLEESSFAERRGFADRPLVNIWAQKLRERLLERFPSLRFEDSHFSFQVTFDIDVAYAYRERPLFRTLGGYAKSLLKGEVSGIISRTRVLLGAHDPYDTFGLMQQMQKKYGYRQINFFLLGEYGKYDKNIDPVQSPVYREAIRRSLEWSEAGIHPSYGSGENPGRISSEIRRLADITGSVRKSRQHYLRMKLPDTYRVLESNDITYDYTMGYASRAGFRAGICTPYPFYDLHREREMSLTIVPFQVMDGTLKDYMGLDPEAAVAEACRIMEEVREVKGLFVLLWHNHSLCDQGEWKGWRAVFERIVQKATQQ
jgi:hypothetical protein